jgi:hypothetical protein
VLRYRTGWHEAHETAHRALWIVLASALALALGVASAVPLNQATTGVTLETPIDQMA